MIRLGDNDLHVKLRYVFLAIWLGWGGMSEANAEDIECVETGETHIWISPLNPKSDDAIRIMSVSTDGPVEELTLIDSLNRRTPLQSTRRGGPPWSLLAFLERMNEGNYRVVAGRDGELAACHSFVIGGAGEQQKVDSWNLATEAFYSAWIEELFGAPIEESISFSSLEPVLRNTERNFLHNYFGRNEDRNLPLTPDCADLPYTLRAYFAWKVGLPVSFRNCGRGSSHAPPRCGAAIVKSDFTQGIKSQHDFVRISRLLADTVHSGSARTGLDDEVTDQYPIALNRETIWPGTVYADPYGHVLVVVEWVPQTGTDTGMLLVADAQPDNSVTRKQAWEGTMLFAESNSAGAGFKAFRPLVRKASGGWRTLSNAELADHPDFLEFSLEQDRLTPDDFYAKLSEMINPNGLDPKQAYDATLDALVEQIETRVNSVNNGEAYIKRNPGSVIPMPGGKAIFQTVGPWEDYSTPSRDMRLIIAMNVLNGLPDKVLHHPELFLLKGRNPEEVRDEIEQYHAERIQEHSIEYTRSDGSFWKLTVADV
ncbi:MAG: hypothetical protein ACU826_12560, partial [Gammaproteobacteria bacterium]